VRPEVVLAGRVPTRASLGDQRSARDCEREGAWAVKKSGRFHPDDGKVVPVLDEKPL